MMGYKEDKNEACKKHACQPYLETELLSAVEPKKGESYMSRASKKIAVFVPFIVDLMLIYFGIVNLLYPKIITDTESCILYMIIGGVFLLIHLYELRREKAKE